MDEFLEITRRIKTYMEALGKNAPGKENTEHYLGFLHALNMLAEEVDRLSTPGEDGQLPMLTEEKLTELKSLYGSAAEATDEYLADETPGTYKQFRNNAAKDIRILLMKDRTVLDNLKAGPGTTIRNIYDRSRVHTVDMGNAELKTVGGFLSKRIPLQYTDENGRTVSGFFTETSVFRSLEEMQEAAGEEAKRKHPRFSKEIDELVKHENVDGDLFVRASGVATRNRQPDATSRKILSQYLGDRAEPLLKDAEFCKCLQELGEDLQHAGGVSELYAKTLQLTPGSNIDGRNASMSIVAGMLGVANLIAYARPMKLKVAGKVLTGTFMEKAVGKDINRLEENDELLKLKPADLDTPEIKRQVCDIQVLDYICGNIDRHPGNMLYSTENGKLKSIMGIDNDASFARAVPKTAQRALHSNMTPLQYCKAISEELADRVLHTTRDMMTVQLAAAGLTAEEIDCAWLRMKQVQDKLLEDIHFFEDKTADHVESGRIRIVKAEDWDKISMKKLALSTFGEELEKKGRNTDGITANSSIGRVAELDKFVGVAYGKQHDPEGYVEPQPPAGVLLEIRDDVKALEQAFLSESELHENEIYMLCDVIEANDPGYIRSSPEFREMKEAIYELADYDFDFDDTDDDLRRVEMLKAKAAYLRAARLAYQYQDQKRQEEERSELAESRLALAKTIYEAMSNQVKILDKVLETHTKILMTVVETISEAMKSKTIDENEFINAEKLHKEGALMYPARDSEVHIVCTNKKGEIADFKLKEPYKGYSRVSRIKNPDAPDPLDSTVTGALSKLREKLKKSDPFYVKNSDSYVAMKEAVENLCKVHASENLTAIPEYQKHLKNAYKSTLVKVEDYILEKAGKLASKKGGKGDPRGELRLELALTLRTLLNRAVKVAEKEIPVKEVHHEEPIIPGPGM